MADRVELDPAAPRAVRRQVGNQLRKQVPRSSHEAWAPASDRTDPLTILQGQDKGRVQELLPIKYGRMVASPFAFLRGSAAVMAADLAHTPTTGIYVQLCGDAHISNFGVFATPERQLVFDVNDFDETLPGPWEWDVKRLVASAIVAGWENGFDQQTCQHIAQAAAETYGEAMKALATKPTLDVWYYHVDAQKVIDVFKRNSKRGLKQVEKMFRKAEVKTQGRTLEKLTEMRGAERQFVSSPPLLVPLDELLTKEEKNRISEAAVREMWEEYLSSLSQVRRHLLRRFRVVDGARRVGGVGSVGTRCWIVLVAGGAEDDALILQLKEASASVLEEYLGSSTFESPARRVVEGQRLMQAASDIFLGWHRSAREGVSYYWRQLKDMKGAMDVSLLNAQDFETYVSLCAACLARAHARSGDAAAIAGYIGRGGPLPKAMAEFGFAYADQTLKDHQALQDAIGEGRINAETGV